jgi:hypothetical protein
MQTNLAAAEKVDAVRSEGERLTASLAEQAATAGMTADEAARWRLEQQGATQEQLAAVAAAQQQAALATETADARKAANDAEQQRQQALADSVKQTTDQLREQIDTWGMSADEAALAKLRSQGASESEIASIKEMQDQLAALKRQKDALSQTETTIGAGSMADAYDAIQRAREAGVTSTPMVDRYAGIGEPVPAIEPPGAEPTITEPPALAAISEQTQSMWDDILGATPGANVTEQQLPLLERIARGIEAVAAKEGVVIEEVKL